MRNLVALTHSGKSLPFPQHSLLFAPLEGVTDPLYRQALLNLYPEWSRFSTDFLRIPSVGHYSKKHYVEHFGEELYQNSTAREKTTFQILTSPQTNLEQALADLHDLGFDHLDLNLGCPSRTVNSNKGGAYLLSDLPTLETLLRRIKKNWPHVFTVKIRVGYRNDDDFSTILKIIEQAGIDAITIHGRTRDQMYKGRANWNYSKIAVESVNIPIIGNGDIWTPSEVRQFFDLTHCYAIMLGRSAMKTPWMPKLLSLGPLPQEEELKIRAQELKIYYQKLVDEFTLAKLSEPIILKRLKSVSRNTVEDFIDGQAWRSQLLRSMTLEHFFKVLNETVENKPCPFRPALIEDPIHDLQDERACQAQ